MVTFVFQPADNGSFMYAFAHFGHFEFNLRHIRLYFCCSENRCEGNQYSPSSPKTDTSEKKTIVGTIELTGKRLTLAMQTVTPYQFPMAQQDETIRQAVQQYRKRLFDFIRVRVKETADAEDILQDVFYELTSTYRVLQPVEQMAAWLFRVARNTITDRYRKHKPVLYDDLHQGTGEDGESNSFLEELLGAGDDPGFMSKDNELIR